MRRNTRRCWLGRTTSTTRMERTETKREYRTEDARSWQMFDVNCRLLLRDYQIIIVLQYVFKL